ncbi:uncharacterized protein LOC134536644 [Bacillus rossius redtenbacheri]|uniref:uncharacterized protein LOC134536644 n=1 Tax=Bacillus rossius redtenbacheri TaxID=93214 RepID=UPI002FDCEC86
MMAVMEVPVMSKRKWTRHEQRVEKAWEDKLEKYMLANGVQEREIALKKGNIDEDGIPYITVYQDGGWCTRSYGHGFTAKSGVACIIGAETNGLLYVGIRNKYCYICNNQEKPGSKSRPHKCYKNYKGTSTGMEQEIIVQGFKESESMHGVRYLYIISDGDSSSYLKIQRGVSYGRHVVKLECANHMIRNYTSKLHAITKDTTHVITARRQLSQLIPRLTRGARAAIASANKECNSTMLQKDLKNGPYHVFGDHENCRDTFCVRKGTGELNNVPIMSATTIWPAIMKALDPLITKADKLLGNKTTNQAERFMSLISKFSGGKRTDVSKSGRYKRCCLGASLSHIKGPNWHLSPVKTLLGRSPGSVTKRVLNARATAVERNRKRRLSDSRRSAKRKCVFSQPDCDYGPEAAQPDISTEEMERKKTKVLKRLESSVSSEHLCHELERNTVGQHCNVVWREARLNRLTASSFSKVCKMRCDTSCHNMVVSIVHPKDINTGAIRYGRMHESTAIKAYENKFQKKVSPCGLFVHPSYPYLGASPDGTVENDTIIEVKCFPSINNLKVNNSPVKSIREASKVKNIGVHTNSEDMLELKRTHPFFYQIQGQLNISKRKQCVLILFCDFDTEFVHVQCDETFWKKDMLPKLERFYFNCVLPEIVDPRNVRGLKCRDPEYIEEAKSKKLNKEVKTF